jgi:hypothetical protein
VNSDPANVFLTKPVEEKMAAAELDLYDEENFNDQTVSVDIC